MYGNLSNVQKQQKQQQAEIILSSLLAAWQEEDPARRLAACAQCKLDGFAWQLRWLKLQSDRQGEREAQERTKADPASS